MALSGRHGRGSSSKMLSAHTLHQKQVAESKLEVGEVFYSQSLLPVTGLLNLPKQCHQLWAKCSAAQEHGATSHPITHTIENKLSCIILHFFQINFTSCSVATWRWWLTYLKHFICVWSWLSMVKAFQELERWLGCCLYLLLLQRSWIQFLAPKWWLKTIQESSSKARFWSSLAHTRHARGAHIDMWAKHSYTKISRSNNILNKLNPQRTDKGGLKIQG